MYMPNSFHEKLKVAIVRELSSLPLLARLYKSTENYRC